jgi:hypothetical protein
MKNQLKIQEIGLNPAVEAALRPFPFGALTGIIAAKSAKFVKLANYPSGAPQLWS